MSVDKPEHRSHDRLYQASRNEMLTTARWRTMAPPQANLNHGQMSPPTKDLTHRVRSCKRGSSLSKLIVYWHATQISTEAY